MAGLARRRQPAEQVIVIDDVRLASHLGKGRATLLPCYAPLPPGLPR
jgi:hypothetical protein